MKDFVEVKIGESKYFQCLFLKLNGTKVAHF